MEQSCHTTLELPASGYLEEREVGAPVWWLSGWAPAFGSGRDPGIQDQVLHWALVGSLLLPLPVSLPLCVSHE